MSVGFDLKSVERAQLTDAPWSESEPAFELVGSSGAPATLTGTVHLVVAFPFGAVVDSGAAEDAEDVAVARARLAEPGDSIPWETLKGELGL